MPQSSPPRQNRTALFGGDDADRSYLHGLGLNFDELDPRTPADDLTNYRLVICRGELPESFDSWEPFFLEGGNLLVHRASAAALQTLRRTLQIEVDWQPFGGAVARSDTVSTRFGAIAREDLYWLGEHEGISWATTPRAPQMADSVFGRRIDESAARPFEIEAWQLDGQIVERRGDFVTFATVGAAEADIEFPTSGTYLFGVVGRGTPCDGTWPVARVSVDGKPVGDTSISSHTLQTGTTFGRVEQGRHRVRVAFVNDASNPQTKEDRNLVLDRLLVARDDVNDLGSTSPPAVVTAQRGAGRVVVDQLRWDEESRNASKAARYASALLTALDGDFAPRFGVAVQCETMRPQPGMPHFHVFDDHVGQATNGTLSRSIRIARAGTYRVELVAWGTPLDGEFPLVDIHLGQRKLGQVRVDSESWRSFPLSCDLPAGQHDLILTFVNDANRPGEGDRNVMYDKVVFYRE